MTRLYEFIAHRGHVVTERRAHKADPDLAAREAARRVKPGIVLGTEGPGGLDGLFADMEREREFRPWWWKATLHVHWWIEKYGPRQTWYRIKAYHQRGKRGWSDRDAWGFDHHLAMMIRDGAIHLREIAHGHPCGITYDEWLQVLQEIADGMQAALTLGEMDYDWRDPQVQKDLEDKHALAMDLLKTYWFNLWD